MNLKAIDAAISAYRPQLDGADLARLSFFRALWDVQDLVSARAATGASYRMPDAQKAASWLDSGEPLLLRAPAPIDEHALLDAAEAVAACLVQKGGFSASFAAQIDQVSWERLVKAGDVALAGSDPKAYLQALTGVLAAEGFDDKLARVVVLGMSAALRALLEGPAARLSAVLKEGERQRAHPLSCPVCGSEPSVARVSGTLTAGGCGKELWCGQCGTAWGFERVRCARCGTRNQARLHYASVAGDEAHRIASCEECGGYLRTVYQDDALAPFSFEVEDVVMARLDLIARQQAAGAPTGAGRAQD